MNDRRIEAMVRGLTRDGGLLGYGPEQARLLLHVLRALGQGQPLKGPDIDTLAVKLGWTPHTAHAFLRPLTERDAADAIIGVLGLSLGEHPHRFSLNGHRMSTWCAEDTLFLPALLGNAATIESTSPLSREPIRLAVGPGGVQSVSPRDAVISVAILDPDETALESVEAIWMKFCRHVHFFASREEATRWAGTRDDIVILTPNEGYHVGRQLMSRFLDPAAQGSGPELP